MTLSGTESGRVRIQLFKPGMRLWTHTRYFLQQNPAEEITISVDSWFSIHPELWKYLAVGGTLE